MRIKRDPQARQQLIEQFRVDKDRVRALHGNAVLSRYPIRDARLVPFKVGYDWFKETKISPLEKTKRKAAVLIGEDLLQEVRRGGRTTLFVDLDVPEVAGAPSHHRLRAFGKPDQAKGSSSADGGVAEPDP